MTIHRLLVAALALGLAPSLARARSVEVEIQQQAKDKSPEQQSVVLEVGDVACARVRIRLPKAERAIKVCPDKTGFNVELFLEDTELEAHAPSTPGQRVTLARFKRPDGSTLEVAMTAH